MTVVVQPLPKPVARPRVAAPPNATLSARRDVTDALAIFYLALDESLVGYRPGQYLSVGIEVGSGLVERPYSIVAIGADATRIELFVRRLPDGRFSNLLWSLAVGDRLSVGKPKGLFTLHEVDSRPRLMIGTGTGVAPL